MAKRIAKKSAKKTAGRTATRSTAKRDLVSTATDTRYAKRRTDGTFAEMDDVGRSQKADRPRAARTTVKPGFGDQGDQPKRASKKAAKKR